MKDAGGIADELKTFNLSILECKFRLQVWYEIADKPFNLSILECKSGATR